MASSLLAGALVDDFVTPRWRALVDDFVIPRGATDEKAKPNEEALPPQDLGIVSARSLPPFW
jgi:hypothetical protein